ncbi:MAG: hypothetical protein ACLFVE_15045 [Chitinispirillaceae bacterium]
MNAFTVEKNEIVGIVDFVGNTGDQNAQGGHFVGLNELHLMFFARPEVSISPTLSPLKRLETLSAVISLCSGTTNSST